MKPWCMKGNMVIPPLTRYLVSCEEFGRMDCAATQGLQGMLRAREKDRNTIEDNWNTRDRVNAGKTGKDVKSWANFV